MTYFLGVYSGSNKETSDIESFVELTVDEANGLGRKYAPETEMG